MAALKDLTAGVREARRLVVKVGSALLVDVLGGGIRQPWFDSLIDDLVALHRQGAALLVVSSGAVALGAEVMAERAGRQNLVQSQAAAAVGQIRLAHAWQAGLARHGLSAAQILLTIEDTETRRRYLNARGTIGALLAAGAVPVINENDSVATGEIRYGDNDRLAARVAAMIEADCLLILSDVAGLFSADPASDANARLITEVAAITPETERIAGRPKPSGPGSGGMITKVAAARIATAAGCGVAIIGGADRNPVSRYLDSGTGTWFAPAAQPLAGARKKWIGASLSATGGLIVDDGAVAALRHGSSLLAAGIGAVSGEFEKADTVRVLDTGGAVIATGMVSYSAREVAAIRGLQSDELAAKLGYRGPDEVIHRDNLVLAAKTTAP